MTRAIRVLVVDDVEMLAESFTEALRHHDGIEVIGWASDGMQALHVAHESAPDIVLMDVRMPVMDGIAATKRLADQMPEVKVLIMSAYEDDSLIAEAMDAGAVGYLVKGTLVADTVVAIRAAFERPRVA
jgi:DNA-binding NarL/FixJ family response regulator